MVVNKLVKEDSVTKIKKKITNITFYKVVFSCI